MKKVMLEVSPKRFLKNRGGQVWIETVIYTLIALVMIGAVLNWGKPKIEELQDKAVIEQTIGVLEDIDSQILSVAQGGPGNKRTLEVGIKKGSIQIDMVHEIIFFELETRHTYSEPGQDVEIGNIIANTKKTGEINKVSLIANYSGTYDLKFEGRDEPPKVISKSTTPYKLVIVNAPNNDNEIVINMTLS